MEPPDRFAPLLPARVQPLIALGVAIGLAAAAVWFISVGGLSGRLIHHDAAPTGDQRFTVNINVAGETEVAQLPGLGNVMARRIIDHRREHGPFTTLDGLLEVAGIGPATLQAMRPHLRPIRRPKAAADLRPDAGPPPQAPTITTTTTTTTTTP
ncbi:MAG: helix-hairpin-helix domain-containing protein [Planctomycetota bacterium]